MELRQYVEIVLKRWWLILATTVLATVAAFVVSTVQTPEYRSTATIEIRSGADPAEDPYYAIRNAEAIASTYVIQITSPTVIEAVVDRLQLSLYTDRVQKMLSAAQVGDSSMVEISAESISPALAQALANTAAEVFIEQQAAQEQARFGASLTDLEGQIATLEEEIMTTRGAIANIGDVESLTPAGRVELARLETQVSNDQTRLSVMLNSTEQFRLAMAKSGDYISIFSSGKLPTEPFAPQTLRNTALAAVVGAMIGVGTAFLLDYLDDTIRTPEDARDALGINVLGTVPDVTEQETVGSLAATHPLTPAAEAFRNLRTSLQYASLDNPLRTVLVTSTEPNEGKSFVSSNLATAFAVAGRKVLLIEADLRRPTVHRLWDLRTEPGLTETLRTFSQAAATSTLGASHREVLSTIHTTPVPSLYILTAGARVSTPSEMLSSQTFRKLLDALLQHFDMLILDSPPVLTATDAAIVSTTVDGTVMVTVSGETRLPSAARSVDRIAGVGGKLLGVVVNRLTSRSGGYYYRYYNYQYDYTYGAESEGRQKAQGTA